MGMQSMVEQADGARRTDGDAVRTHVHGMWEAVSAGWDEHADFIEARGAAITESLLAGSELRPGDRVLELACGPGGLGLAAAQRVAPDGAVVASDVAPGMVEIAASRAMALGLTNVTTRVLDLESIDEPDASFDAVLCREGLMFAFDPVAAAREIRRVLKPGGRVAVAVWGPRSRNPWLGIVLDSASEQIGAPVPPPGIPGPFALDDTDRLRNVLDEAGLDAVDIDEVAAPMRVGSFDEWWSRTSALAGPLAKMLASLPGEARDAIRDRAREGSTAYATAEGLEFPGVSLVATGRCD